MTTQIVTEAGAVVRTDGAEIRADNCSVYSEQCKIYGDNCTVYGNENRICGPQSVTIRGYCCTGVANHVKMYGNYNVVRGKESYELHITTTDFMSLFMTVEGCGNHWGSTKNRKVLHNGELLAEYTNDEEPLTDQLEWETIVQGRLHYAVYRRGINWTAGDAYQYYLRHKYKY